MSKTSILVQKRIVVSPLQYGSRRLGLEALALIVRNMHALAVRGFFDRFSNLVDRVGVKVPPYWIEEFFAGMVLR